jgi:hypothetical protein
MLEASDLIKRTQIALEAKDGDGLREIYHECSEESAVNQNPDVIKIALITYCFSKLLSKVHYREKIEKLIEHSIQPLNQGKLDDVLAIINEFDKKNTFFEGSLVDKARVKIASKLYSAGLSISQASELLNANLSDVLDYVGVTKVHNEITTMTATERLKIARRLFK